MRNKKQIFVVGVATLAACVLAAPFLTHRVSGDAILQLSSGQVAGTSVDITYFMEKGIFGTFSIEGYASKSHPPFLFESIQPIKMSVAKGTAQIHGVGVMQSKMSADFKTRYTLTIQDMSAETPSVEPFTLVLWDTGSKPWQFSGKFLKGAIQLETSGF